MKLITFLALAAASIVIAVPTNGLQARGSREDPELPHIEDGDFIDTVMNVHWYWRRVHCAQDLEWDADLAQEAFNSVNACTDKVQHVSIQTPYNASPFLLVRTGPWRQQPIGRRPFAG
jgi:hypothetical protein